MNKAVTLTALKKIVYSDNSPAWGLLIVPVSRCWVLVQGYPSYESGILTISFNKTSQEFSGSFWTITRRRQNTSEVGLKFSETSTISYENRHLTRSRVAANMADIRYPENMCYIYEFPVKVIFYLTSPSAV